MSQFANLNFSHLISLKFSELCPKLMVTMQRGFKKVILDFFFVFYLFSNLSVHFVDLLRRDPCITDGAMY